MPQCSPHDVLRPSIDQSTVDNQGQYTTVDRCVIRETLVPTGTLTFLVGQMYVAMQLFLSQSFRAEARSFMINHRPSYNIPICTMKK